MQEGLIVYLLSHSQRHPELRTPFGSAVWALITAGVALSAITLVQELGQRYNHHVFRFGELLHHAYLQGKDSSFRAQGPCAGGSTPITTPSSCLSRSPLHSSPPCGNAHVAPGSGLP